MIGAIMAITGRPSPKVTSMSDDRTESPGLKNANNVLQETLVELKKTTWPTRQEANRLTLVVIGIIIALGIYMGGLDALFSQLDRLFKLT